MININRVLAVLAVAVGYTCISCSQESNTSDKPYESVSSARVEDARRNVSIISEVYESVSLEKEGSASNGKLVSEINQLLRVSQRYYVSADNIFSQGRVDDAESEILNALRLIESAQRRKRELERRSAHTFTMMEFELLEKYMDIMKELYISDLNRYKN